MSRRGESSSTPAVSDIDHARPLKKRRRDKASVYNLPFPTSSRPVSTRRAATGQRQIVQLDRPVRSRKGKERAVEQVEEEGESELSEHDEAGDEVPLKRGEKGWRTRKRLKMEDEQRIQEALGRASSMFSF